MNRCSICDYTEAGGAPIVGVPPGGNGKVRKKDHGDYFCDICAEEVNGVLADFHRMDDEDEGALPGPDDVREF